MAGELGTESSPDKVAAPYYVRGLSLGVPAYLIGVHLWTWVFMLPTFLGGRADFRQLYTAGFMVRSGYAQQLYDYDSQHRFQNALVGPADIALPFNHLSYEALLFAPFSLLPFRSAYFTFLATNLALLALCFRLLRPGMDKLAEIWQWLPAAMFLGFLPVAAALMQGQDSILLLTLLVAATVALQHGRDLTAGALVGFGLFKFQIVLPIALLLLLWRRWRFSAGFALSAAAVGLISLWLVGAAEAETYVRSLIHMSVGLTSRAEQFRYGISPAAMPNLRGLIFGLANARLSAFWLQAVTIFFSGATLLAVAVLARREQWGVDTFLVAITASALVSYHLLIHDLSVVLIPIALTLNRFIHAESTEDSVGRLIARLSALMFIGPICISYIPGHFYLVSLPLACFLLAIAAVKNDDRGVPLLRFARSCFCLF
jgi:hypothetical protein